MKTKSMNNKGIIMYAFLILFLLINLTSSAIMIGNIRSIQEESLHLKKEKSRMLAESGLEIALSMIHDNDFQGIYEVRDEFGEITIEVVKNGDNDYFVKSRGIFMEGKTQAQGNVWKNEETRPLFLERKMW